MEKIRYNCTIGGKAYEKDVLLMRVTEDIIQRDHLPSKKELKYINLFNNGTTRKNDSYLCDYMHGNSLIFGKKPKKGIKSKAMCKFCTNTTDSAAHQLFYCEELKDESRDLLINELNNIDNYQAEVLIPFNDNTVQNTFIKRVIYLQSRHEELEPD